MPPLGQLKRAAIGASAETRRGEALRGGPVGRGRIDNTRTEQFEKRWKTGRKRRTIIGDSLIR